MPLSPRTVVAILVTALIFGMGIGAVSLPPANSGGGSPSASETPEAGPTPGLTAVADQQTVAANQRLTISGQLTPAERGVRLVVQRLEGGDWQDFPAVTTTGADGSYSVWIQSGRKGENTYRLIRSDDSTASDEVRVTVV